MINSGVFPISQFVWETSRPARFARLIFTGTEVRLGDETSCQIGQLFGCLPCFFTSFCFGYCFSPRCPRQFQITLVYHAIERSNWGRSATNTLHQYAGDARAWCGGFATLQLLPAGIYFFNFSTRKKPTSLQNDDDVYDTADKTPRGMTLYGMYYALDIHISTQLEN